MPHISQLYVYPVKSLGGIAVQQAEVTSRGLQYDRRWMLIDHHNNFLSQRKHAALALFEIQLLDNSIMVTHRPTNSITHIPYVPQTVEKVMVHIWDDVCSAAIVSRDINQWFSNLLKISCQLVYMDDNDIRPVDPDYAGPEHITSFSDAYPTLLIGKASLDDLNTRLPQILPMDRFRPNMVIAGTAPYLEDTMHHFSVGSINFYGVKLCARCIMTTIDQQTAAGGSEPLKTLAGYRKANNKIYFGQNLIHDGSGVIKVGDGLIIQRTGSALIFDRS